MIYLRPFAYYDWEWVQKHRFPDRSRSEILDIIDQWHEKYKDGLPFAIFAICDNVKIVGNISANLQEDFNTIRLDIEILPKFRRKGYGTFAMRQLMIIMVNNTYNRLIARIPVNDSVSIAFHESLGYTPDSEETDPNGNKVRIYRKQL